MFLKDLIEDARSIRDRDPAARTTAEVFLLYPGFHALIYHKLTHWLYLHKRFFLARMISQFARTITGVEIHPGAKIGRGLFIDHGMGIVIGETADVGDYCTIYHGVTLGRYRQGHWQAPSDDWEQCADFYRRESTWPVHGGRQLTHRCKCRGFAGGAAGFYRGRRQSADCQDWRASSPVV